MHNFFSWAEAHPERLALTMASTGEQITAGALAVRAKQLAQWLASQGLKAGDVLAVLLENRSEILEIVLASKMAGLYSAVIGTHLTPPEVAYIVQDCNAQLVITSTKTLKQLREVRHNLKIACWTVDESCDGVPALEDSLKTLTGDPIDFSDRPVGRDLLYSSGTTGRPKGVMKALLPSSYRHQMEPEVVVTNKYMRIDASTIYLSPAPMYHAAPLRFMLRVLDLGGQAVIMDRFDAEQALALIERHQATHSQWVPTMLSRMLQLPDEVKQRYDLSSHKVAIHAAAPCPIPVKQAMLDWWGDILLEYYGGSEGCGITLIHSSEWRERPGSVGRAISGQVHIVGDDGQELGTGERGLVYFSGISLFAYLNDEEKTQQAINEKGWATYGDIGHVDEQGYLFLSDRRTDLILSGGVNLYPQEIETALLRHPAVYEAAVVGVPHVDFGEQALAVIVLQPGAEASETMAQAIAAQTEDVLSKLKRPQRMVFVDSLPKLETGKLLRRVLKDRYHDEAGVADHGYDLRKKT
ncbi:AMP-binding protein [Alcaligenaceae bacterium]|nr:AMP-binding protein [Alcaligenaceae bacterium]